MSIKNLLERPIPPQPKGWGLLGQRVEPDRDPCSPLIEGNMSVGGFHTTGFRYYSEKV